MATIDELYDALQSFRTYIEENLSYKHTVYSGTVLPTELSYPTNVKSFYFQMANSIIINIFYKFGENPQDWSSLLSTGGGENIFEPTGVSSEIVSFTSIDGFYGATGYINVKLVTDANVIFINLNIVKLNSGTSQSSYTLHTITTNQYQDPSLPITEFISSVDLAEHAFLSFTPNTQIALKVDPLAPISTNYTVSKIIIVPSGLSNFLQP